MELKSVAQLFLICRPHLQIQNILNLIETLNWRILISEGCMFIRIYTGLLVSVIIAGLLSYGFYAWQYQQRQQNYLHSLFGGSFYLLNKGLQRHTGEKQERWLQVMERLLGSKVDLIGIDPSEPLVEEVIELTFTPMQTDEFLLVFKQGNRELRSLINDIGEQHYRMMATLIRNELGRIVDNRQLDRASYEAILEPLEPYFSGLKLNPLNQISIDPQQLSRLKRYDTVVLENPEGETYIYSRIPNSDDVISIGPIAGFNPLPLSNVVLMMVMSLLITAISAYVLVYRIERRVKSIQYGVHEFSKAPAQLPELNEEADVIGQLAWSINGMSLRIHQLLLDQKQMIQAISHELRTPMSRMKFRLQILQDDQLSDPSIKSIAGIGRDIDEVNGLIDEALAFDRGSLQQQINKIELNELISLIVRDLRIEFDSVVFEVKSTQQECFIHQDKQQIKRLIQNLIQNACKYGGGKVIVSINRQKDSFLLQVEDNGDGIPDERKSSVFSPFTRLETSRNKHTGGIGLGLAIAKNIADLAGIKLLLSDSLFGGACFSLELAVFEGKQ